MIRSEPVAVERRGPAPRLEIDLRKITDNARHLVDLLAPVGIAVTGVTKASLGSPAVAGAMISGGVVGIGESRVENIARLRRAGRAEVAEGSVTLIRSPMPSQVEAVVALADASCNTELAVIEGLSRVATTQSRLHVVVLMVELGDLREGVLAEDVVDLARATAGLSHLRLGGLGANLACQNGVLPDATNMAELTRLVELVERSLGVDLAVVSGGNSANLDWALSSGDLGRVNDLRLGESILLGRDPWHRGPIPGLHTDAFRLVGEVIESKIKPSQPWGALGEAAFGRPAARADRGPVRQSLVALGRQDIDPAGLVPPVGTAILGASSDHLVLDTGVTTCDVGAELAFDVNYSALLRAMTSPFVDQVFTPPERRAEEPERSCRPRFRRRRR